MVICKCNFLSDEYCRIFILKIFKLIIGLFILSSCLLYNEFQCKYLLYSTSSLSPQNFLASPPEPKNTNPCSPMLSPTITLHNYRQDLPQAALPVLFLLTADFWVFRPAGATRCADQGRNLAWRSTPPCQISPWSAQGWGLRPPKLKKMEFYQYNCPLHIFYKIYRLYARPQST